ncbi:unnamed protein product [Phytophthora lilii]|uniref:Unnamed protein product n=1 Tax=Phytophthora lilii TaxID=2077276 RepID=A0A9W6WY16_9STRA|nr:unnamed protein product [Phytophthora lilii]
MLQDLEGHVNALKAMFEDSSNEGQSNLVDRLIGSYPVLNARLADLLEEIDVRFARRNDIENTIQRRIRRNPSKARKYCEFTQELETLERQYDAILVCCKSIFNNSSLEYVTFRGGSLNDIHHLIEVKRKNLYEVPQDWLVVNSTKKVVRFHPKEIVQLHVQEEFLKEQKDQLVRSTWRQFVREVDAQVYVMGMQCVSILAKLDALCSLATVAQSYSNYTLPEFVDDGSAQLEIIEGRHPVIETLLKGSSYISNSVTMVSNAGSPGSLLAISGPNMGGKTSLLRMCALVVILAQMGSFVPAASARLTVFDGVYTLMHRAPLRLHGSSACASELTALGIISRNATRRSLVLIDEVGIGMTAHEAEALAVAQMVYFVNTIGCHVVFATHLAVATKRLQTRLGGKCCTKQLDYHFYDQDGEDTMKYANAEVDEQVTFHYVLRDGIANDSFAFETAKRAGIAPGILERARNLQV